MRLLLKATITCFLSALSVFAAQTKELSLEHAQDKMLSQIEKEVVSLAEAMPAEKYNFRPSEGAFTDTRTFGQQVSHLATTLYLYSSAILGEKMPVDRGQSMNGPASLNNKNAIVKYVKDAFAYAHRAAAELTLQNFMEPLTTPYNGTTRGELASRSIAHSFDHYGQAVIYARLNGIVPPASRPS